MGTGNCSSPANACRLRLAVNRAAQGDAVVVLSGTYRIASTLTPEADVSLTGRGRRPVILLHGSGSLGDWSGLNRDVSVSTNLHERPGAPTINAGTSTGLEATDLEGRPRIIGPAADIGGYEFRPH